MMPVLPVTSVPDVERGIELAKEAEHGFGHSAGMYSSNIDALAKVARATRVSPSPVQPVRASPDRSLSVACGVASWSSTSVSFEVPGAKKETTRGDGITGIQEHRHGCAGK